MSLLGRADTVVPEQLEKVARPRIGELVVTEVDAGAGVLQKRGDASAVGVEDPIGALPVDEARSVRRLPLHLQRA